MTATSFPYLQKNLAKNPIGFFSEHCGEDDGHTVRGSLDENSLLVAIINLHQLALASSSF